MCESVSVICGIGVGLIGMFLCMTNCTGDVTVSTIVARKTGELDIARYNS